MQITIEIPDPIVQSAQLTEAELLREIAIVLFQQERITLGKASELANLNQIEFQKLIASRGISVHYDVADYEADLESLQEDGW
jgi:predicted HTH domain antitoxin